MLTVLQMVKDLQHIIASLQDAVRGLGYRVTHLENHNKTLSGRD